MMITRPKRSFSLRRHNPDQVLRVPTMNKADRSPFEARLRLAPQGEVEGKPHPEEARQRRLEEWGFSITPVVSQPAHQTPLGTTCPSLARSAVRSRESGLVVGDPHSDTGMRKARPSQPAPPPSHAPGYGIRVAGRGSGRHGSSCNHVTCSKNRSRIFGHIKKRSKMTTTNKITTSAGHVTVWERGAENAPAVLLIHGNSACKEIFQHQMGAPFKDQFHMIAVDLPGHGGSDPDADPNFDPHQTYTMKGYAGVMVEVLDALGISEAAILGWSLGGHVALEMVPQYNGVRGILITGTPPLSRDPTEAATAFLPHPHMALTGKEVLDQREIEDYAAANCGNTPMPFMVDAVKRTDGRARAIMIADAQAGGASDQKEIARTMTAPLAIVNGADEPFVSNAYLQNLGFKHLWGGGPHFIDDAGHAPFWEQPSVFNGLFERFLKDVLP